MKFLTNLAGALPLLLLFTVPSGCSRNAAKTADAPQLRVGFGIGQSAKETGVNVLTGMLYAEGLVAHDWNGRTAPALVGKWEWSDDHKNLRLHLKPDVLFHDGTPLTAEVVVQFLKRPENTRGMGFRYVTDISVDDASTVLIRLSRPDTFLLTELSDLRLTHPDNPDVGTGPFRLRGRKPAVETTRFEKYHGGVPELGGVRISTFDTHRAAWAALMRGEVDVVQEVTRESVDFMENSSRVRTFSSIQPFYISLVLNHANPILANTAVRRAVVQALDREAIVRRAMNGLGQVTDSPVWPMHWAYKEASGNHTHNPSKAAAELDRAGFILREAANGRRSRFSFRCLFYNEDAQYEQIALMIERQLFDIGIDVVLEPVNMKDLPKRVSLGNYDAVLVRANASRSLNLAYLFWRSKSSDHTPLLNTGYTGADKAFDTFRFATSDDQTRVAVAELIKRYYEDAPAVFIAWTKMTRAINSAFTVTETKGPDPFGSIWQWRRANTSGN